MEMIRKLFWVALILMLGGCSGFSAKDNADPPAELVERQAELAVETLWQQQVGGTDGRFLAIAPALDGELIYIANATGQVSAIERAGGKTRWQRDTGLQITGGPGVGEGLVLVGTAEAELLALSGETGEELWRRRVSSEVLAPPVVGQGVVVARTINGRVAGFDLTSGQPRWVFDRSEPLLTLRGNSAPLISNGQLLVGFSNGKLVSLSLESGNAIWEATVSPPHGRTELERIVDLDADPLAVEGMVYAASFQGEVAAIAEASGVVLWRRDLSVYAGMDGDWRTLYVSDDQAHVWALDATNGAALWQQSELHARRLSAPAIVGDYLVVGDFEGYLHWLSQDDGRLVARTRVGDGGIRAKPLVVDGVVYVYDDGGRLSALRPGPLR
jgi:outer membrane protein assembly factor BamB